MTPIETEGEPVEPTWDSFGINRIDFRPNWDGDFVNVFSTVEPQDSEESTANFIRGCTKKLAEWVLENRKNFGQEDRFQIIIGWPKSVCETNRQVIKIGGTYDKLREIASGQVPVEPRKSWSVGVF